MELLVDMEAVEDRLGLGLLVVVLDPLGQLGTDGRHVFPHLFVEGPVVDHHPAVVAVELFAENPHGQVGLAVQKTGSLRASRFGLDQLPLIEQAGHVPAQLVFGRAFGGGPHDQPMSGRTHLVNDPAEATALVVTQTLGYPEGVGVGHEHGEATGEGDLLSQSGPLCPDGVLGDLAEDRLSGAKHVFDPGLGTFVPAALNVVAVIADVAPVQDRIFRDADVDEGRLHAWQHILDPAPIDVAVDLGGLVGRPGHVVLDQ